MFLDTPALQDLAPPAADRGPDDRPRPSGLARLTAAATPVEVNSGETIYAQDQGAARFVYEVLQGMVRTARLTDEGRRVVHGFFAPGEVFGIAPNGANACSAEAVCDAVLARCERAHLESVALVDPVAARQVWAWVLLDSERSAARLSLLAYGSALQKVAHFLLEMAGRLGQQDRVQLPMSRYDIADYVGLSSETVSRTFTAMRERGLVATDGRSVVLLKPDVLRRIDAPN